jgi:hypothetical protein
VYFPGLAVAALILAAAAGRLFLMGVVSFSSWEAEA